MCYVLNLDSEVVFDDDGHDANKCVFGALLNVCVVFVGWRSKSH